MNKDVRTLVYAAIKGMTLTPEQWYSNPEKGDPNFIEVSQPSNRHCLVYFPLFLYP